MTFRYNRTPTGELPGNSLISQTEAALSALSGVSGRTGVGQCIDRGCVRKTRYIRYTVVRFISYLC